MARLQYSMPAFFVVTGVLGAGCCALLRPSAAWVVAAVIAIIAFLLLGTFLAIKNHKAGRAFWSGVALFGWTYLVLVFGPVPQLSSYLPTSVLLRYLYGYVGELHDDFQMSLYVSPMWPTAGSDGTKNPFPYSPMSEQFWVIGHSLFGVIVAVVGGVISRQLYIRELLSEVVFLND
ncbi:MAG: hypothetical protein DWQ31_04130 [Planctomycetota bacterium]|nr:MAG: hypothetical protein DWQ31_04130 [Planctomycetota bacterium]REJ94767.1 MAG: hypothetical protein DWQ35_07560 [Planctomycetota bacterium]REK26636.1 MAG: hypothetical protein DWQ42_08415 [Planctomycetota bacterium]REK44611.1 MAG: hypothetical protein DWQ46_09075 [Planctomycetota bacterium]